MNPLTLYTATMNPLQSWSMFAWKTGEMMLASAQVIGHRSKRMLLAGPSPVASDRREFALMGQEKVEAAAASSQAMALGWMRMSQEFGAIAFRQMLSGTMAMMSLASIRTPAQSMAHQTKLVRDTLNHSAAVTSQLNKSVGKIAHRGLKPIHSRATGNAKRLAKRR
ncbi:MAG: polyhydroxyalkanoate granule-associated phasin [Betaproteobacteria bacterium]